MDIAEAPGTAGIFSRLAARTWRIETDSGTRAAAIHGVCSRPELRMLADGVTFRVVPALAIPCRACAPDLVELSPAAADSPAPGLAVYIRHALEIALWHRVRPRPRGPVDELVAAACACATALGYVNALPEVERTAALAGTEPWFQGLADLHGTARGPTSAAGLVASCVPLLPLQGAPVAGVCDDPSIEQLAARITAEALRLAAPSEVILGSGGDSRLRVDPASRLNKYGCSTAPRPVITFSSCTASSPSDLGYWSAESVRRQLIEAVAAGCTYAAATSEMIERTRDEVGRVLGTPSLPGTEIVLAASGTDCELLALHAALEGHTSPLLSIVIGPDEIGSGSLPAASGRHFDDVTPLMLAVPAGAPVDGLPVERVRVQAVRLRDDAGRPVPIEEVDREVTTLAQGAVAAGSRVLLHVVDSSKTGMRAPSFAAVAKLQEELGTRLLVLIDAAQMRTRPERLKARVAAGAMVMISGSKFFTGAPFSGALVVPPHLARRMREVSDIPHGFCAYFSGVDVPPRWGRFRAALPGSPNLGLLMRWRTALAEMQAFDSVPLGTRNAWYAAFRAEAAAALRAAQGIELVEAPLGDRTPAPDGDWDRFHTIFTFFLREDDPGSAGSRRLDYEEAWGIYLALNRDVSALLPAASARDRALAARPCHTGQPVRIQAPDGSSKGALRLAVGARFVSRVAYDPALGADPATRLDAQLSDLRHAVAKIELVVRSWRQMMSRQAGG